MVDQATADSHPRDLERSPLAVRVDDLHIRYKVFEERRLKAKEFFSRGLKRRKAAEVHALRGVSFDVRVGESLGIVGTNGSGKSTCLRAIAGLEPPTSGEVLVRSQPRLLGVNAALQPALSGHRNIVLGALALGLPLAEIEKRYDDVVAFSGLGDAIERPLETYSSGMRARLAFSVATLTIPDILLIDEALAVGDRQFRERSLERIRQIRDGAGTVIMVTHNLGEIRATCKRTIWLEQGSLKADGPTEDVLEQYEAYQSEPT